MLRKLMLGVAFSAIALSASAQMREVVFYEVRPAGQQPPVIDGKLDDACWAKSEVHDKYYRYFVDNPPRSPTKSEMRILYDAKGLYIGIVNFDEDIGKLRKNITTKGDANVWTDDCAEIYIDRYANGIEYRRFVVNCIGTTNDTMRLDEANMRYEWDADGWEAKATIQKDRWIIEAFIPWTDLGSKAEPGALWSLLHARFTPGKGFGGYAVSSPGGNMVNTRNFGFIYFTSGNGKVDHKEIASLINKRVAPPWGLAVDGGLLQNDNGKISFEKLDVLLAREQSKFENKFNACAKAVNEAKSEELSKSFALIVKEYGKAKADDGRSLNYILKLIELTPLLDDISWKIELENM